MSDVHAPRTPVELSIEGGGDFEIVSALGTAQLSEHHSGKTKKRDLSVSVEGGESGYDVASTRRIGPGLYEVVLTKIPAGSNSPTAHDPLREDSSAVSEHSEVNGEERDAVEPVVEELVFTESAEREVAAEVLALPQEVEISIGDVERLPEHLNALPGDQPLVGEATVPPQEMSGPKSVTRVLVGGGEATPVDQPLLQPVLSAPSFEVSPAKKRWYQRKSKGPTLVIPPTPRASLLAVLPSAAPKAPVAPPVAPSVAPSDASSLVQFSGDPGEVLGVPPEGPPRGPVVEIDVSTGLPRSEVSALTVPAAKDLGRNWRGQKVTEEVAAELPERPTVALWEYFASEGFATAEQLDVAYAMHVTSQVSVMEALVAGGVADESALVEAAAAFSGLEVCDLPRAELDPAALDLLPESIAREHRIFPEQRQQ